MRALVAAVCLMFPAAATAGLDPQSIAVAPVTSPSDLGGLAGIIGHEAEVETRKQAGIRVIAPDDVERVLGPASMKRLVGCQVNAPCAAVELATAGAARAIVGLLDRDDVHYVVRLALIDVGTGKTIAAAERTVLIASRTLEVDVAAMLPDLLAGKSHVPSTLTITSNARHARATIDDAPLGEVPVTVDVSPGRHEVKVEKVNYLPTTRFIEVAVSESQTVTIRLTLLPNRIDPDAEVPVAAGIAAQPASGGSETSIGGPIPSLVALGVGVAALGVGIGFGVATHNIQVQAVDTTGDGALDLTRAQALSGQRDAAIATVCYVGAGVAAAAAVGLYFLFPATPSSEAPPPPKVSVAPIPGGASFAVAGAF